MYMEWRPYVPVAQRRANAAREMKKLMKKGESARPVHIEGRTIAETFWGKSWCQNLERYSDYANRLPRGRTYVRNGSVVHLEIEAGRVFAKVSGSSLYTVDIGITAVPPKRWKALCGDCADSIDSLVELLQGKFSKGVMARLCEPKTGLFPAPSEIKLSCSCPDWADMCKHVAAVLYGVGARLDTQPELLFQLRKVDAGELIAHAARKDAPISRKAPASKRVLAEANVSDVFGIDLGGFEEPPVAPKKKRGRPAKKAKASPRKRAVKA